MKSASCRCRDCLVGVVVGNGLHLEASSFVHFHSNQRFVHGGEWWKYLLHGSRKVVVALAWTCVIRVGVSLLDYFICDDTTTGDGVDIVKDSSGCCVSEEDQFSETS